MVSDVTFQSFLLFLQLILLILYVNGTTKFANPQVNFPFVSSADDDGDYLNLNVSYTDFDDAIRSYDTNELRNWPGSACARECNDNEPPRICYYEFTLEYWNVLGRACSGYMNGDYADCYREGCVCADGVERGILTVNRQLPGPSIHVCKNDIVVVDVKNRMGGNDESIHWHGILQHGTPWMDGVSYITQCPIHSGNIFRYAFVVSINDVGTFYWHSHTGHHKVNGIYGAFIVHDSREADPNSYLYECDDPKNVILVSDWFHTPAENLIPGLQKISQLPVSVLINGRGSYRDQWTNERTRVPLTVFRMNPKKCASNRFRLINGASSVCPMEMQIEGHRLQVIALDSYSSEPVYVDSIFSAAGERIDFVIDNEQPENQTEYWIVFTARGVCERLSQPLKSFAILSYADESITDEELTLPIRPFPDVDYPRGITLNKPETICGGEHYCPSDVEDAETILTREQKIKLIEQEPDEQIVLAFNNYALPDVEDFHYKLYHSLSNIGKRMAVGAVNNITFALSHISLNTQTQEIIDDDGDIDLQTFCNRTHLPTRCTGFSQCPCTYRVKCKTNSVIDLILIDDTRQPIPLAHPFHLHGHGFYVMNRYSAPPDQPINAEIVQQAIDDGTFYQRFGQEKRPGTNYGNPCKKDTVQIPSKGLVVLRVLFDNPGFWIMHCHIDWHLGIGMAFLIQVGELDEITPPPNNFPTCRDYKPTVELVNVVQPKVDLINSSLHFR